ncbi:hypothetical protein F4818DRAFT_441123 [Hypoxylon cercidicola]|nr:hypothetical protein F4818DRAFT_441123 [Hypoxylon cercidicola]
MSSKSGPSAATTSNSSRNHIQPVALENYLASPPTVTEALAFPSTTGDTASRMENKTEGMKESLDKWQSTWDSLKEPKK